MGNYPMVSIIIPVFNGSNYLREAILSAINQTYKNIEVVVINDGSDDRGKTREIALSFGKRIRYFEKENGGVSTALNKGIQEMKGEYFSWLSHDDRYRPNKISDQIKILNKLQDKKTVIYGGYDLINENGSVFYQVNPGRTWTKGQLDRPLFPIFKGLVNGCTLLIHKSYFEENGLFDERLISAQDTDMWFRIFKKAQIYYQYEINVETRVHEKRGTAQTGTKDEKNAEWIRRMHSVTSQEMRETMESPENFYKGIMEALGCFADYKEAYSEAEKLYNIYSEFTGQMPLVSVVIPFYNQIDLLIKSTKSVISQTYRNLEILLIDDGSKESIDGLQKFISSDKRIRLIRQIHSGSAAARNRGIKEAKGSYIAFLDSDDLFLPQKIEKQLQFMMKNQLVFSHTSYKRIGWKEQTMDEVNSAEMHGIIFPQILNLCVIATSTVMVKRIALQNIRFTEGMRISQDICMWIDLAYCYEAGGLEEYLSLIRVGEKTTFFNKDKVRKGYLNVLNHIFSKQEYLRQEAAVSILLSNFAELFKDSKWTKYS